MSHYKLLKNLKIVTRACFVLGNMFVANSYAVLCPEMFGQVVNLAGHHLF